MTLRCLSALLPNRSLLPLMAALLATPWAARAGADEPVDWAALARSDLEFAAQALGARHPGAVLGHAQVTAALERGLRHGRADLPLVKTQNDYRALMRRFVNGFGDPHTSISVGDGRTLAWNGLLVDQIDGRFRVVHAAPGRDLPPVGSEVLACDGVWVGAYLKAKVAPEVVEGLELSVTLSELARRMMLVNEFGWQPSRCRFRLADGSLRDLALNYTPIDDGNREALRQARAALRVNAEPVGVEQAAPGVLWMSMPSFNMGDAALVAAYEKAYAALRQHKAGARWVVFDLRGNSGGATALGAKALEAFYDPAVVKRLEQVAYASKVMVTSAETLAQFRAYLKIATLPDDVRREIQAAADRLEQGLQRGDKTIELEPAKPPAERAALLAQARQRPAGPRLAAVIDRGCFSSCMGFVLMLQGLSDTLVLGEPTLGYSPYGEIMPVPLPSGQGELGLPSAYFEGEQATQQPFVPQRLYGGRMNDPRLKPWVLQQLRGSR